MKIYKKKIISLSLISTGLLSTAILYFFLFPKYGQYFPKCIFHSLTNLYCPGCGSQRCTSALMHGNFLDALRDNLLVVVSIPFLLYAAVIKFMEVFYGKKVKTFFFYSSKFSITVLIIVVLFWVLRNIPFPPFNCLAPVN